MNKKMKVALLMSAIMLVLSGCCLKHTWMEATCTEPMICSECGKEKGEENGHTWEDATCTEPRTCTVCQETKGDALGHDLIEATCTEKAKCTRCGAEIGDALGHDFAEATCTENATCTRCGLEEGDALGHDLAEATCTEKATCTRCGAKSGEALGHDHVQNVCTRCGDKLIETYDELRVYLKDNFRTLHTALGDVENISYKINSNEPNYMHPYDFEIQIGANDLYCNEMKSSLPYMIQYGDAFAYEDRIQAFVDILDFEMEIIKIAEAAFPGLKFRVYYFDSGYEYPNIKVGYSQSVLLPFYNYRNNRTGKNGYVGTDLCDWYMTEQWFFEGATVDPFIYCYDTYDGRYACEGLHQDVMKQTDYDLTFEGHYY